MTSHCCEMMRTNVERTCAEHPNRHDCPDSLVEFWPASRAYDLSPKLTNAHVFAPLVLAFRAVLHPRI
ncbi:MAG: DUF6980 family protein [Sphingomicrobium sp.]